MLAAIGLAQLEELFAAIPPELRLKRPLAIPPALTEMELTAHLAELAAQNHPAGDKVCFLGGGSYDHFIPAVVDMRRRPQRVLHRLHALPGRGQPGQPAGVLRVPDADHATDRHGRLERQPVRRRQRGGRGRADGHARHRPQAAW